MAGRIDRTEFRIIPGQGLIGNGAALFQEHTLPFYIRIFLA